MTRTIINNDNVIKVCIIPNSENEELKSLAQTKYGNKWGLQNGVTIV